MVNVFVSYCQKDRIYADYMDLYFKDKGITFHKDIRDIQDWKSIKEYMNSIRKMDYAILVITDNYLKSYNCMYEVLEVMKDNNFKDKIFPVVAETNVYSPKGRISHILYWENRYEELEKELEQVGVVNLGSLPEDLKRTRSIASSMSEFLGLVADMNNPSITDVNIAIENKLIERGVIGKVEPVQQQNTHPVDDVFASLNISRVKSNIEPTDLEKNQFIGNCFKSINELLGQLCNQLQRENNCFQVNIDSVDSRTVVYQIYKNGTMIKGLKLFLGNVFGGRDMSIGISSDAISIGNNNSYNGIISLKFEKGQLSLYSMMSMAMNQRTMTTEEAVKYIWESYIQPYLLR
jgi:hypothetical protein